MACVALRCTVRSGCLWSSDLVSGRIGERGSKSMPSPVVHFEIRSADRTGRGRSSENCSDGRSTTGECLVTATLTRELLHPRRGRRGTRRQHHSGQQPAVAGPRISPRHRWRSATEHRHLTGAGERVRLIYAAVPAGACGRVSFGLGKAAGGCHHPSTFRRAIRAA
jgi:hypothetical protein